jgi:hypothetical protein
MKRYKYLVSAFLAIAVLLILDRATTPSTPEVARAGGAESTGETQPVGARESPKPVVTTSAPGPSRVENFETQERENAPELTPDEAYVAFSTLYECYLREVGGGGVDQTADCTEFGAHHHELMDELLSRAAAGGNLRAQLSYFAVVGRKYESAADVASNLHEFSEFRTRAAGYLVQAANSGSVDAMVTLAAAYEDGIIVDRNPVAAYTYWLAAQQSGLRQSVEPALARLRQSISQSEASSAEATARRISSACCP